MGDTLFGTQEKILPFNSQQTPSTILTTLKELREEKFMTDVVITCEDGELEAHRIILCAGSPVFKSMFENHFKESISNHIDLHYMNKKTLVAILDYLYLSSTKHIVDKEIDELITLLEMVHYFDIQHLIHFIANILVNRMTHDNCLQLWNKFVLFDAKVEMEMTFNFILRNLSLIIQKKDAFLVMNEISMKQFMAKLFEENVRTEAHLLDAIINWCKAESDRKVILLELLFCFRFDDVSKEHLEKVLREERVLFNDRLLTKYIECHVTPKLKSEYKLNKSMKEMAVIKFIVPQYVGDFCLFEIREQHVLRLIELFEDNFVSKLMLTPLSALRIVKIFQRKTALIFLIKHLTSGRQYLVSYDLETEGVLFKSLLPFRMVVVKCHSWKDRIYIIGYGIETDPNQEFLSVQIYRISTGRWETVQMVMPFTFIASGVINDQFFVLFEDYGYYFNILNSNESNESSISRTEKFQLFDSQSSNKATHIERELTAVFNDKIFCFVQGTKKDMEVITLSPDNTLPERQSLVCSVTHKMLYCCSIANRGIFLFPDANGGEIYQFDPYRYEMKKTKTVTLSTTEQKNFDSGNEIYFITT